jgi:choline dehydrogenase-like flavoprotein
MSDDRSHSRSEARSRAPSHEPVDVLIVGAGASGAAFAWSMADTRMRILCLEQGGWMNPAEYPTSGVDWEIRGAGDFALSPNQRGRSEDYPINDDDSPIKIANFNAVGGSTILYAAHFPRLKPSDFRVRTLDGVADDWPIDFQTLEPYWAENSRIMGVAGLAGDPAYPPRDFELPPIPLGKVGEKIAGGFNAKGWHWWPSDSAIATREFEGRPPCINLGPCITGCAQGAKASTDVTYWPRAERRGVELRTHCRVREITLDAKGLANGVVYFDADGVEHHQPAEIVVLACNGIGTPRLLLNSTSKAFPDGLANRSGLVGRNLMLHPYAMVLGLFGEPLDGHRGPTGCGLWSHEFYETDAARDFVRGFSFELMRSFGPMTSALWFLAHGALEMGRGHHESFARIWDRLGGLLAICEDLPEEHNRVTLDPDRVDSNGIPAPRVSYTLSSNSRKMLDFGIARATEVLEAAGAERVISDSPLTLAGWHLMGTARMGTDPERSVVNEWGRSHDVKNLFIVDGSLFVTSGGVNPCNTIQALALYVADNVKKNLAQLFD